MAKPGCGTDKGSGWVVQVIGVDLEIPFQRLTYAQAMERYGSDKPDLRYGLEHHDISEAVRGSTFRCAI